MPEQTTEIQNLLKIKLIYILLLAKRLKSLKKKKKAQQFNEFSSLCKYNCSNQQIISKCIFEMNAYGLHMR